MTKVSVILSVYNNRRELPRAMQSILRQTYRDYELIAIDDGSCDGSGEELDRFSATDRRIKVIHQENTGLGQALARACQHASGEYLARQDADDVSAPTRIERQITYMESKPDVVVCGTWCWFVDPDIGPVESYEPPDDSGLLSALLTRGMNPFVHGSMMIRGSVYREQGIGYRSTRMGEDFDLWLRMRRLGKFGMVTSPEYFYWNSIGGICAGTLEQRARVVDLFLRLDREPEADGNDLLNAIQSELALLKASNDAEQGRFVFGYYTRGLAELRRKNWSGYRAAMREASKGSSLLARKARVYAAFGWAAPLTRLVHVWRLRQGQGQYLRPLPVGTPLPDYLAETCS